MERFDVVILDLTDPVGVCERLYTEPFYRNLYRNRMAPGGLAALHQGFPFTIPERTRRIQGALRQVFAVVRNYSNFVPLYGDPMLYALCGDRFPLLSPGAVDRKIETYGLSDLNYISGEAYAGLFGLPRYIRRLLDVG